MFEFMTPFYGLAFSEHRYTFAATGLNVKCKEFVSRRAAEKYMHKLMNKHGLFIKEIYDDKHFKTYLCNKDVRFYINRM